MRVEKHRLTRENFIKDKRYTERRKRNAWAWSFAQMLSDTAVPALEKWIKGSMSHPAGMTPERWGEILTKILNAFKVSKATFDGKLDFLPTEERMKKYKEYEKIRKEGFVLMAEHFLDMWD